LIFNIHTTNIQEKIFQINTQNKKTIHSLHNNYAKEFILKISQKDKTARIPTFYNKKIAFLLHFPQLFVPLQRIQIIDYTFYIL